MPVARILRRPLAVGLALIGVLTFVLNLLALILPVYMLQIYDRVLQSGSLPTLLYLTLIAVAGLALLGAVEAIRQVVAQRVGARLEIIAAEPLLARALSGASSDAPRLLGELGQVRSFLGSPVFCALLDAPFTPLFLVIVFAIHPALGLLVVGGIAVLLSITLLNRLALERPQQDRAQAAAKAGIVAMAAARAGETIRAMGMVPAVVRSWGTPAAATLQCDEAATRVNAVFSGLSRFVRLGVQLCVLGLGAYLVLRQEITAGMIFATSLVAGRALAPIDNIVGGWKALTQALESLRAVSAALAGADGHRRHTRLAPPKGHLSLERVSYLPAGAAEPTLKGVTLALTPGEAVCVLGPAGAGKSTLARIAAGALSPSHGAVRLDGSDLENWEPADRGRFVGYLPQDIEFLPASIAANIARLDSTVSDAEVLAAAELAGVTEVIKRLPRGFDTLIGPGGLALSGGQRQRIALARAVLRLPRLVVLDEPNAHLDAEGEEALHACLGRLRQAKSTVIVVSQRAGVLQSVDRALMMRDGQIVGSQSRDETLARISRPAAAAREARA